MILESSYIILNKLTFHAYHGVSAQENKVGNTFVVDLRIQTNLTLAVATDQLEHTISYAEIYQAIKEEMNIPSKLLEHACGRIANKLFERFPAIEALEISLAKSNPPMGADIESAAVVIHARRG